MLVKTTSSELKFRIKKQICDHFHPINVTLDHNVQSKLDSGSLEEVKPMENKPKENKVSKNLTKE